MTQTLHVVTIYTRTCPVPALTVVCSDATYVPPWENSLSAHQCMHSCIKSIIETNQFVCATACVIVWSMVLTDRKVHRMRTVTVHRWHMHHVYARIPRDIVTCIYMQIHKLRVCNYMVRISPQMVRLWRPEHLSDPTCLYFIVSFHVSERKLTLFRASVMARCDWSTCAGRLRWTNRRLSVSAVSLLCTTSSEWC